MLRSPSNLEEVWDAVRLVPSGRVSSYGAIGRMLNYPATGRQVGRWMSMAPKGLPWWRIVGHNGAFPIGKRDPVLELTQKELLLQEGVQLKDERVKREYFWEQD